MTCDASYHIVLRSVDLVDKQPRPPRLLRHYLRGGGGDAMKGCCMYVRTEASNQRKNSPTSVGGLGFGVCTPGTPTAIGTVLRSGGGKKRDSARREAQRDTC